MPIPTQYLAPSDPGALEDIPAKEPPNARFASMPGTWVPCPVCDKRGEFNLQLNSYGPRMHFRSLCAQCFGYGWVQPDSPSALCVHRFVSHHITMHTCISTCQVCGYTISFDTSG